MDGIDPAEAPGVDDRIPECFERVDRFTTLHKGTESGDERGVGPHYGIGGDVSRAMIRVDLPEGRARFSGGSGGGSEEIAHDTFAVELDGSVFFGQVEKDYDGDELFLEIPTFGYAEQSTVGLLSARRTFTVPDMARVMALVRGLANVAAAYPDGEKPYVLSPSVEAYFAGRVDFEGDWILIVGGGREPGG